jgi:hypothetical protein
VIGNARFHCMDVAAPLDALQNWFIFGHETFVLITTKGAPGEILQRELAEPVQQSARISMQGREGAMTQRGFWHQTESNLHGWGWRKGNESLL